MKDPSVSPFTLEYKTSRNDESTLKQIEDMSIKEAGQEESIIEHCVRLTLLKNKISTEGRCSREPPRKITSG